MPKSFTGRKRIRKTFGRIPEVAPMPNLIEVQRRSYEQFLQREIPAEQRKDAGLQEVFKSVFPIRDFSNRAQLDFVRYELEDPRYDVEECQQRGMTFAALLKVTLRLVVWDVDEETGSRSIRDIKEQDVYMGDMPLMTDNGTFIINGTERVIVSQMHKSPGVFFTHDKGKSHSTGKILYSARIIPQRGSWIDFEFDTKDILYVRIDRKRKFPATVLLRALGYSEEEIARLNLMEILHPDCRDRCAAMFQQALGGETLREVPAIFVAKDGRSINVEGNVSCRFEDGKPVETRAGVHGGSHDGSPP